ncbi:MAG: EI24 domain-containing protein [Spirochaetes bacterium]|nr:EI24 domain-containing protein [Spirochaetota bacterium]
MGGKTTAPGLFRENARADDSFFRGLAAAPRALRFVRSNRGMAKYFVIPFLLNIIILSSTVFFIFTTVYDPLLGLVSGSAWYNRAIEFILAPLLFLALAILIVLLYSILGSVITAPFNDFLSRKVEETLTGSMFDEKLSFAAAIKDVFRVVGNVIKLLGLIILVQLLLLFLNLIPAAGSVLYSVTGFLATSFFIGFQFFDFPLERRRYRFREKMTVAWRFRRTVAGVGASVFLMTFIPLAGFLGLNIAAVSAAMIFVERVMPALRNDRGGASS